MAVWGEFAKCRISTTPWLGQSSPEAPTSIPTTSCVSTHKTPTHRKHRAALYVNACCCCFYRCLLLCRVPIRWHAFAFKIQVTASAERQRHGKRQLAIGRQVPSESGMASAEGAARQVRERSGKRQVAEARQAPSEVSTASAERERHGKRRGGVAQQAQSRRERNKC